MSTAIIYRGECSTQGVLVHTPNQLNTRNVLPAGWPEPLREGAFYGLAGDFVRLVAPESEADSAALLVTFLVGFGCMLGRGPHFQVEATRHGLNLFSVLVGRTSKARKGTATDRMLAILKEIDPGFVTSRRKSGLSSGEGLIEAVRDSFPDAQTSATNEANDVTGGEVAGEATDGEETSQQPGVDQVSIDLGSADKRLLVIEGEFASVLKQFRRDGNTLSNVLREAWDGRPLQILARKNKDQCAEPHISMIGNITGEELVKMLTSTECFSGLGNRVLWCCANRSKLLSHGGKMLNEGRRENLIAGLRSALRASRSIGQVRFAPTAAVEWERAYATLSQERAGLVGALTARSEAQVRRIATIYALLDSSALIQLPHLDAAMEVRRYCEDSVQFIFGGAVGDDTADRILTLLRAAAPQGMTGTQIYRAFNSHKQAVELKRALTLLEDFGRVRSETEPTAGKSKTRWFLDEEKAYLA